MITNQFLIRSTFGVNMIASSFLHIFPGDLCPRRLNSVPGAPAAGGPGRGQLLLSATQPAGGDEPETDAVQVERDVWPVRKCIM